MIIAVALIIILVIINPYAPKAWHQRLVFAFDDVLMRIAPLIYEGLVIPCRRKIYDIMKRGAIDSKIRSIVSGGAYLFTNVEVETVNWCNGDCSFCPASVTQEGRPRQVMEEGLFRSLVDQLKDLDYSGGLALYSNNEPLLDPRICDFADYARDRLPNAFIYMMTNWTLLTEGKLARLMGSLDKLIIDNYSDDLDLLPNVRDAVRLCLQNEAWRRKAVVILRKKNEFRTNRAGQARNRKSRIPLSSSCLYPFSQVVVRPDGKLSLCCNDVCGVTTMGDLKKEGLLEAWRGDRYRIARSRIARGRANYSPCIICDNLTTDYIDRFARRLACP
ncbi:MAG: radical SAM/SPASM domain-containing protein [Candidatus Methanosuratincola verstraetei]|jgi:MoaA/NifB/PqqE/SkfB family radical SAM enzyme